MSKKQTAVEWLVEQSKGFHNKESMDKLIEDAKRLEREQIEEAFSRGLAEEYYDSGLTKSEYYTQTYGECTHKS